MFASLYFVRSRESVQERIMCCEVVRPIQLLEAKGTSIVTVTVLVASVIVDGVVVIEMFLAPTELMTLLATA